MSPRSKKALQLQGVDDEVALVTQQIDELTERHNVLPLSKGKSTILSHHRFAGESLQWSFDIFNSLKCKMQTKQTMIDDHRALTIPSRDVKIFIKRFLPRQIKRALREDWHRAFFAVIGRILP